MKKQEYEQVNKIFNDALRHGSAERKEFLDKNCRDNEDLRDEVESLLSSYDEADSFMETPAIGEVAESFVDQEFQLTKGQEFEHYIIIEPIGKGGMGEVYLAEDKKLKRRVALKLLPARFIPDKDRLKRFEREAFAVSSLNHPNILIIYGIGENEDTHFISTEYVEGKTLGEYCADKGPGLNRILDIAAQCASALSAAHKAGIIHRDIKPENIMVRTDGYVKFLDFGVAKLTERHRSIASEPGSSEMSIRTTETGVVLGTASYMSPEQARGLKTDERTDIWSLGVVLYEMLSGEIPFKGNTPTEVIAEIIHEEPTPISKYVKNLAPELERIVTRTLSKEPDGRYQTAAEFQADLERIKHEIEFEDELERTGIPAELAETATTDYPSSRRTSSARYLVSQIKSHKTFAISIIPVLLIGIMAAGYYLTFNTKTPVLTDKDVILLIDFENKTGEEIFDGTLKQGVLMQLRQSPFLSIFPEPEVKKTLKLMKRSPDKSVTREIGREICQRQGLKAYVVGTLTKLGDLYVLGLEAIDGQTGETIALTQAEAESKEKVLDAISAAATGMREDLGESLALIEKYDKPLPQVTTGSLEAFKAFTMALEMRSKRNRPEAITLFEQAIKIDPEFALAYAYLGNQYDLRQVGRQHKLYMKANNLRDKVSEREKLILDEYLYGYILQDVDKKLELMKIGKLKYPRDFEIRWAIVRAYVWTGQYENLITEVREMSKINPKARCIMQNIFALIGLDRLEEAKKTIRTCRQTPDDFSDYLFQIAFVENDTKEMQRIIESMERDSKPNARTFRARVAASRGQWRRSRELSDPVIDNVIKTGVFKTNRYIGQHVIWVQTRMAAHLDQCRQARIWGKKILTAPHTGTWLPRARTAHALARCGERSRSLTLMEEMVKRFPSATLKKFLWLPIVKAEIELRKGNAAEAVRILETAEKYEHGVYARFYPQHIRGRAYLEMNEYEKARIEFQKILDHRGEDILSVLYPLAQLGKARAMKDKREYEKFFEMWKEADRDLPALINARKEYEKLK